MKALKEKQILLVSAVLLGAAVLIVCILLFSTTPKEEVTTYSMGSYVQQTVYGANAKGAAATAANAIAQLEDILSWRKPDGDIALVNAAVAGTATQVDVRTYDLLSQSLAVAKKSGGAFDPTIAPLSWLWNFDESPTAPPSAQQIAQFQPLVNWENLILDESNHSVLLQSAGAAVDLGAIGKGAACDLAVEAYQNAGVSGGIVAVGGSVGCFGKKPDKSPWAVAIRDPSGQGALGSLTIEQGFFSTSGNYEKTFTHNGAQYHHLLNPKTGHPAESGLTSVTVVCDNGALADALSTACFVLGLEAGQTLLADFGAQGLFIDNAGGITLTSGLHGRFTLTSTAYSLYE